MKLLFTLSAMLICGFVQAQNLRLSCGNNTVLAGKDTVKVNSGFFENDLLSMVFTDEHHEPDTMRIMIKITAVNGKSSRYMVKGTDQLVLSGLTRQFKPGVNLVFTVSRKMLDDETFLVAIQ